jgi:hypothetical protein
MGKESTTHIMTNYKPLAHCTEMKQFIWIRCYNGIVYQWQRQGEWEKRRWRWIWIFCPCCGRHQTRDPWMSNEMLVEKYVVVERGVFLRIRLGTDNRWSLAWGLDVNVGFNSTQRCGDLQLRGTVKWIVSSVLFVIKNITLSTNVVTVFFFFFI